MVTQSRDVPAELRAHLSTVSVTASDLNLLRAKPFLHLEPMRTWRDPDVDGEMELAPCDFADGRHACHQRRSCVELAPSANAGATLGAIVEIIVGANVGALVGAGVAITMTIMSPSQKCDFGAEHLNPKNRMSRDNW